PSERKNLYNINYFVLYNLPFWIHHYKRTAPKSSIVLQYEKMRKNILGEFVKVFECLNWNLDKNILKKSIKLSSFENIKKMSQDQNQEYGFTNELKGQFMRSGNTKQYLQELNQHTIHIAINLLTKDNIAHVLFSE
ncbi:MAG: sulfotransferase domain-containing protein, partial [Candidatus Hodarchaeota archaeon]